MLPISNWELVLALATFPHWQHLHVFELESVELESGTTDLHGRGFTYARPFKGQIHEYSEIDLAAHPRANSKQKDCMFIGILRPKRR